SHYYLRFVLVLFFYCYADHRDLHSFPTRRSSDLRPGQQVSGQEVDAPLSAGPALLQGPLGQHPGGLDELHVVERHQRLQGRVGRSEEHTSELQSQSNLVCRLLLEKKKTNKTTLIR